MKVSKVFSPICFPYRYVLKSVEGFYFTFNSAPFRRINESDLSPLPFYREVGEYARQLPDYLYSMYGLEKG